MPDRREYLYDLEEGVRSAIEDYLADMWKALPCQVTSVNLEAQTLEAQPLIQAKVKQDDGTVLDVTLPLVVDCPIVWPRGGGYALTFPVAIGDEVLIIFSDRCIDQWWQSGEVSTQIDLRMHDLSDGFAILAPTSQPNKLSDVSATSVQLRNNAKNCLIEITNGGDINITATGSVNINAEEANITTTGSTNITADEANVNAGTISISAENTLNLSGTTVNITGATIDLEAGNFKVSANTIDSTGGTAAIVQEIIGGYKIDVVDTNKERPIVNWD